MGWECPVCHKGNAPSTPKCLHCADAVAVAAPKKLDLSDLPKPQPDKLDRYKVTCATSGPATIGPSPQRRREFTVGD